MTAATADAAIVGCGIIGLAAAERLGAAGLSVVLIDPRGVANGASGASGGLVRAFALDPRARRRAASGLAIYLRRGWHGRWPQVREDGSLTLLAAGQAPDTGADVWSAAEVRRAVPGLTVPDGVVGVYERHGGWLPARAVAEAMLRDAGPAVTVLPARATAVRTAGSRVTGVDTDAGPVTAAAVVLAAGAGSTDLAATVGVRLPLRNRAVSYCLFQRPDATPPALPTVVDATTGGWLRQAGPGLLLAGVAAAVRGVPCTVTDGVPAAEQARVREVLWQLLPPLAGAPVVGGVTAYDAEAPGGGGGDVTVWPDPAGLVTATGWNGGGFKIAPAVGCAAAARVRELIA